MRPPRVCAVVLSWNHRDEVAAFVSRASASGPPAARPAFVIVDNGSTDGSVTHFRERLPDVPVIENGRNLGFAGGMNRGIEFALAGGFDYAWLLNTDMELPESTLQTLLDRIAGVRNVGLASPVVVNAAHRDRWVWGGGGYDLERGAMIPWARRDIELHRIAPGVIDTDRQMGTALLVSLSMVREIGKLDERLFAYYEDDDISMRARAAGYASVICTDAFVYHDTPSFRDKSPLACYLYARNAFLLWLPRLRGRHRRAFLRRQIAQTLALSGEVKAQPAHAQAVLEGIHDGLDGVTGERPATPRPLPAWLRIAGRKPYLVANLMLGYFGRILRALLGQH